MGNASDPRQTAFLVGGNTISSDKFPAPAPVKGLSTAQNQTGFLGEKGGFPVKMGPS